MSRRDVPSVRDIGINQCPSESRHVRIVPSNDVDDSKIIEDVHIPSNTASIMKDIS